MAQENITLLSGTGLSFGQLQSIILPEVVTVAEGDTIQLQNEKGEFLGVGFVKDSKVENFSLLQNSHFLGNAHPLMGSWPNAYETLQSLVPGFSQNDKVTVILFVTETVSTAGVTVNVSTEQKQEEEETPATVDELTTDTVQEFAQIVEPENQ